MALVLGLLKGMVILRKTALRTAERISHFADCTPFWKLYSTPTYLLILGMMGLGFVCRWRGALARQRRRRGALPDHRCRVDNGQPGV